jgi:cellulose synthase/poly-beta-1,6-N-acetylglucosamine synthase-like glycosyltransferase
MRILDCLLIVPVAVICFFQLFYLIQSLRVRIGPCSPVSSPTVEWEKISVLIPVHNSEFTIGLCLSSILANDSRFISEVVLILDHCTDDTALIARSFVDRFASIGVRLDVISTAGPGAGKVAAILSGGSRVSKESVLLLDADIVLEPTAIEQLVSFHRQSAGPFTSCLIFPHQDDKAVPSMTAHVICNNRLYRQSVVQSVKNLFGVANFPGGLQLVEFSRYRDLLIDGFLEDLTATYRVLAEGGQIAILPRVLAYEIERQTLQGLFLQRLRWTIGAIQHLPTQIRTARTRRDVSQKILINSYHVMWEFQHYVITLGLLAAPFSSWLWPVAVAPWALYVLQILRSVFLTRAHYLNSTPGVILHCLVFPSVISAALVGSVALLVRKRCYFFEATHLFRRI